LQGETITLLGSPEAIATAQELIGTVYTIFAAFHDNPELWTFAAASGWTEAGSNSKRLWRPCPFLEEVCQKTKNY
jgi:hypothetical protein